MKKAAFIGTGNMGSALVRAACKALGGGEVAVSNRTFAKAQALAKETGCTACESNLEAAQAAEYIFLCVKPYQMRDVMAELAPAMPSKVLVSVAAGITVSELEDWAGEGVPVLRIIPNTPCAIGRGLTAVAGGKCVKEEHFAGVEAILAASGRVDRLDEHLFDAFNALAGCGPAFVYPFIEALADAGVLMGLPRPMAQTYAAQMVQGAAGMVLESGKHPGQLKDEVCSPGGYTIEGVAALEHSGLRAAAMDAVLAAWRKGLK